MTRAARRPGGTARRPTGRDAALGVVAVRAEVRAAALVSGVVPRLGIGEVHALGLALDAFAVAPTTDAEDALVAQEHGVDVCGTLLVPWAPHEVHPRPVVQVLDLSVLLLGRSDVPVGGRVAAAGFLVVEPALWNATAALRRFGGRAVRRWRVERVRREWVRGFSPRGLDVAGADLERLPAAEDVSVRQQYVVELRAP